MERSHPRGKFPLGIRRVPFPSIVDQPVFPSKWQRIFLGCSIFFRVLICEWNIFYPNWSIRNTFRALFGYKFLSVNGTVCSIIEHFIDCFVSSFGPFCFEFLLVNGTYCSQIGHFGTDLGPFCFSF